MVSTYGGKPEEDGTITGAIHRGWVSVRAELSTYTDQALLEESERGEDAAFEAYRNALDEDDLTVEARLLINRQFLGVKANHEKIRALRDHARVHA